MFCTNCGYKMSDEMTFCAKCGKNASSVKEFSEKMNEEQPKQAKLRTSMKIWMIISFVFAGVFAIGVTSDPSMFAGVFLFGILGFMFLVLAKTPKESARVFEQSNYFRKTKGIPKGAFVGISLFLAFFLFVGIINSSETQASSGSEQTQNPETANAEQPKPQPQPKPQAQKQPEVPAEYSNKCPISISTSMYDNIIGLPELSCKFKNNTNKEIAAIQLYFVPKNVYGEEINNFFLENRLRYDTPISANSSSKAVWQFIEQSVKSGDVYVYSVYFTDGTEWGDRNAPVSKMKKYGLYTVASY